MVKKFESLTQKDQLRSGEELAGDVTHVPYMEYPV